MKYAIVVLLLTGIVGCGGGDSSTPVAEEIPETNESTAVEEPTEKLVGTFAFRPYAEHQGLSNHYCESTCLIQMWPTIRIYQKGQEISVEDTEKNPLLTGTLIDDGTFDFSFDFAWTEEEGYTEATQMDVADPEAPMYSMDCTASTINNLSTQTCLGVGGSSNVIKSVCSSELGQCNLYYEKLN